jgi:hypothetical protein
MASSGRTASVSVASTQASSAASCAARWPSCSPGQRARDGAGDELGRGLASAHVDERDGLAVRGLREGEGQRRPGVAPVPTDALRAVQVAERDVVDPGEGGDGNARRAADGEVALALGGLGPGDEGVRHDHGTGAGRPPGEVGADAGHRRAEDGGVAALHHVQLGADGVGLEVRDRVERESADKDGLAAARGLRAQVQPRAREQRGAEAQAGGRVVVARDDDDGRHGGQARERLVGQGDRVHGRKRPVVEVARDDDRVDGGRPRELHEPLDPRRLGVQQARAVEGAAEVPVGGVQDAHPSEGAVRAGRNRRCARALPRRAAGKSGQKPPAMPSP